MHEPARLKECVLSEKEVHAMINEACTGLTGQVRNLKCDVLVDKFVCAKHYVNRLLKELCYE